MQNNPIAIVETEYECKISNNTAKAIENIVNRPGGRGTYYTKDEAFIRPDYCKTKKSSLRTEGIIDIEKILYLPFYNRYADKTQVFSLYKNDDITRRALHVQLVSRTARDIGRALGLNTDLIEAIALAHDLGHCPFGHLGEKILDKIYFEHAKRHFMHNVQSARILNTLCPVGVSLQTIDGVICHNGEFEVNGIKPFKNHAYRIDSFEKLNAVIDEAEIKGNDFVKKLIPSTLEGAVVRFCDMIAYIGKDRNDAYKLGLGSYFKNSKIIASLTADIVQTSIEKDYIALSEDGFKALKSLKSENYEYIYANADTKKQFGDENGGLLLDAFWGLYELFLNDLKERDENSPVYKHHIAYLLKHQKDERKVQYKNAYYKRDELSLNRIVVDYIASMTDEYFVELSAQLLNLPNFRYVGYFNTQDESWKKYLNKVKK